MNAKTKSMSRKSKQDEKPKPFAADEDPSVLLSNYVQCCKNLGIEPNIVVRKALQSNTENLNHGKQIILNFLIDDKESSSGKSKPVPLGPEGCRAFCLAIRGDIDPNHKLSAGGNQQPPTTAPTTAPAVAYKPLKELRLWQCAVGDCGAVAIADLLRLGGTDLQLSFLEVTVVSLWCLLVPT